MFINRINNISFNGYQRVVGNNGEILYKLIQSNDGTHKVEYKFYKEGMDPEDEPIKTVNLQETKTVNFNTIPEYFQGDKKLYRIYIDDKHVPDVGYYTGDREDGDGFNEIVDSGVYPLQAGQGLIVYPDIQNTAHFDENWNVVLDMDTQRKLEQIIPNIATMYGYGDGIAKIVYDVPKYRDMGVDILITLPIYGGDNVTGHHYLISKHNQIAGSMGNMAQYEIMTKKLAENGIRRVDDFAVTSESIAGVNFQNLLYWANHNPSMMDMFRMDNIKDGPIVLGIAQSPNTRFKLINPSVIYDEKAKEVKANPNYNPNKETIVQFYDKTQVSKEQLEKGGLIKCYDNAYSDNKLAINRPEDTVVPFPFEIKPQEYENRLREYVKMKKQAGEEINLDSYEATMFINQYTHFKIGKDAEGAVFWDALAFLVKYNYFISAYDEKRLNAIPDLNIRNSRRENIIRFNNINRDRVVQSGMYKAQLDKDIIMLDFAKKIKGASTKEEIDALIGNGLPEKASLNEKQIKNILRGRYELADLDNLENDDITLNAIMQLPLDSLEVGDNVVGILSSPFFSKYSPDEKGIGTSRFEFYKNGAGVYAPYHTVYHKVDGLFENQVREFAEDVIAKMNETSAEKLLDENKKYTEYGKYVINIIGKDIAKYAFMKALAGDKLKPELLPDEVLEGKISYNDEELREEITKKSLGLKESTPEDQAMSLYDKVLKPGLDSVSMSEKDINFVANAMSKRINGTTTNGFRLAEAMYNKSGLGMGLRIDACKDIVDWDAVRNGDMTFDQAWDQVIAFWKDVVTAIRKINPNAYIVAEITDVDKLMRCIFGKDADVWNNDLSEISSKYKNVPDAIRRLIEEAGFTSEAAYAVTFTDLLHVFSPDAEYGNTAWGSPMAAFKERIEYLLESNNLDYIRNVWTFADNHDKPSVIHSMALDMQTFTADDIEPKFREDEETFSNDSYEKRLRNARISIMQELTNSDKFEDMPLEAMMNIDNVKYFRTANPRSAAMSKRMRESVSNMVNAGKLNEETAQALKDALVDLTNGNYLNEEENINLQTINIPELQSLENALDAILEKAGISLEPAQKEAIVKLAKQREFIEKYAVRGDFNTLDASGNQHWVAEELQGRLDTVLPGTEEEDAMAYSPYVVSVAALMLAAYKKVMGSSNSSEFSKGAGEFVKEFDREAVKENSSKLPLTEDNQIAINKRSYASRDFRNVITMMMQQAEKNTDKEFTQEEKDAIMGFIFEDSTKAAVKKAKMYASFLAALPGVPSQFYRDLLIGLGFEAPAKNPDNQNRAMARLSELEAGPLKDYISSNFADFSEIMNIRNAKGLEAINKGQPQLLDTKNENTMALLYQDGDDNTAITILNAAGIKTQYNAKYDSVFSPDIPKTDEVVLDEILLNDISLPEGTTFVPYLCKEGETPLFEYVIKKAKDGLYRLVGKDGKKIVLNEATAKNGTMFLKKAGKVAFRGSSRNINKQYNFASNMYKKNEVNTVGENLSIVAR